MKLLQLSYLLFLFIYLQNNLLNAQSVPITLQHFTASFTQTMFINQNSSSQLEIVKNQLKNSKFPQFFIRSLLTTNTTNTTHADNITTQVQGNIQVDIRNNILMENVNQLMFFQKAGNKTLLNTTLSVDQTSLLYFDLNKNYTWNSDSCSCNNITGATEMPLFFLPPFAQRIGNRTIVVNGKNVTTSVFHAVYSLGFNINPFLNNTQLSMNFNFYVDSTNNISRVEFNVSLPNLYVSIHTDFWDYTPLSTNSLILPDDKCVNSCLAVMNVVSNYSTSCSNFSQCKCSELSKNSSFCGNIVTYPISTTIFSLETDNFVRTTYNQTFNVMSTVGNVSQQCQNGLKEFLCKFYFPECSTTNGFQKPNISVFTCGNNNNNNNNTKTNNTIEVELKVRQQAINNCGAFSAYEAAFNRTQNYSSGGSKFPMWAFAAIIAGGIVVVIIIIVVVVKVRGKKNQYEEIKH
jgi:hypothetical protein